MADSPGCCSGLLLPASTGTIINSPYPDPARFRWDRSAPLFRPVSRQLLQGVRSRMAHPRIYPRAHAYWRRNSRRLAAPYPRARIGQEIRAPASAVPCCPRHGPPLHFACSQRDLFSEGSKPLNLAAMCQGLPAKVRRKGSRSASGFPDSRGSQLGGLSSRSRSHGFDRERDALALL